MVRKDLRRLVGSPSATNMFLAKVLDLGLLVPVRWGSYQVVGQKTAHLLSMVPNAAMRRLISWATIIPATADRPVAFLGPRLWRDTQLSLPEPLPILGLSPRDRTVEGAAPQWGAFFADLGTGDRWWLRVGDERVGPVAVPNLPDTQLLLHAAADPRWIEAALMLEPGLAKRERPRLKAGLASLSVAEAPRGRQVRRLGLGPPHRRRLLAPAWWMRMRMQALEAQVRGAHG